jgi:hypothetical protein
MYMNDRILYPESGDCPDSNHTKYINYEGLDLKEIVSRGGMMKRLPGARRWPISIGT